MLCRIVDIYSQGEDIGSCANQQYLIDKVGWISKEAYDKKQALVFHYVDEFGKTIVVTAYNANNQKDKNGLLKFITKKDIVYEMEIIGG